MPEKRTFGRRERRASPSVSWTRSRADRRRSRCIDGAIGDPCPTCATAHCRANENVLDKFREGPAVAVSMLSRCRTQGRRLHRQPDNFDDLPTCVRYKDPGRPKRERCDCSQSSATKCRRFPGQDLVHPVRHFRQEAAGCASLVLANTEFFCEPRRPGLIRCATIIYVSNVAQRDGRTWPSGIFRMTDSLQVRR